MSVSSNELNADTLTAVISASSANTPLFGCHIFIPTGATFGSINAFLSVQSASIDAQMFLASTRQFRTRWNDGAVDTNESSTIVGFDTWFSVLFRPGPFDGGSTGTHINWINGTKDVENDSTANITENFTQIKIGGNHEQNNDLVAFPGSIAEVFMYDNITEANADTIATEAVTKLPTAFSILPDHYWPLEINGVAERGGNDLTSGGSPTFSAGNHPSLSGGGGTSFPPIMIMA